MPFPVLKAACSFLLSVCLSAAFAGASQLPSDPEQLASHIERAAKEPGIAPLLHEAASRYSLNSSNAPQVLRKAFSRVLLEKGGHEIHDRWAGKPYPPGNYTPPDEGTLLKVVLLADRTSTETQAGAALLAKNASARGYLRSAALDILKETGRQDLLQEIVADLSRRPISADKLKASDDRHVLLLSMAYSDPLPRQYAQRLYDELTSTTCYHRTTLTYGIARPKADRERVDLCMRLIKHSRENALPLLDTVCGADTELIRAYKDEMLSMFRDLSHAEKARSSALKALGKLEEKLPAEELLEYYQANSAPAQDIVFIYLNGMKYKLTPQQKQKFAENAKESRLKRAFEGWNDIE